MSVRLPNRLPKYISAAVLAFAISLALPVIVAAQSEESPAGLVGTWRTQVSLINCSTGQTLGPAFSSLLTFARGGTLTGTTRNAAFQPGQRTGDFGIWQHTGSDTYSADSEAFILFTSSGPPVFQVGTQRIVQTIRLSGNSFDSLAVTSFFDTTGNLLTFGCAHAVGTRYE